jgi:acetamidase/formamidase
MRTRTVRANRFVLPLLLIATGAVAEEPRYDHHVRLTPESSVFEKPPILRIKSGDIVRFDSGGGAGWQRTGEDPGDWLAANGIPITADHPVIKEVVEVIEKTERYGGIQRGHFLQGPVYIEDAMPGDSIEVRVLSVKPRLPYGTTGRTPGSGLIRPEGEPPPPKVTLLDLERNVALFAPGIEVPLGPFMGVMAVLPPASEGPNRRSGPPGLFAGNLDLKELVDGSTLYIPVFHPGALFFTGDAHAAQGDGEISGTAIETANTAILQFILHKGKTLSAPRAETPTHYIAIGLDPDLDNAMQMAYDQTVEWLAELTGMDSLLSTPLASIGIDYRITQIVDGTKGIHAMIPKSYFVDMKQTYWYQP